MSEKRIIETFCVSRIDVKFIYWNHPQEFVWRFRIGCWNCGRLMRFHRVNSATMFDLRRVKMSQKYSQHARTSTENHDAPSKFHFLRWYAFCVSLEAHEAITFYEIQSIFNLVFLNLLDGKHKSNAYESRHNNTPAPDWYHTIKLKSL